MQQPALWLFPCLADGSCCPKCTNCEELACDGSNPWKVYDCNLGGLPELDQSKGWVQEKIAEYFNHLIDLGVAGVRIDASKHMDPSQLDAIMGKLKAPGLVVNQEVILQGGSDCNCLKNEDYYRNGKIWEFKSPLVFYDVFSKDGNMGKIRDMDSSNPGGWSCPWARSELAMTFVVNHDRLVAADSRPYTITMFNEGRYRLAMITLLAHPYGQPNILSSINFNDFNVWKDPVAQTAPVRDGADPKSSLMSPFDGNCGYWKDRPMKPYACEHRWPEVRNMVMWRNVAGQSGTLYFDVSGNNNVLMITRGSNSPGKAFVAVNNGAASFSQQVDTKGMPAGTYCNIVTQARNGGASVDDCYPCKASCPDKVTVSPDGRLQVQLPGYQALAIHINAMVSSLSAT
jgi:alpha-amylase